MVKYFPRYLITTAKHAVKIDPIQYLGKYMPICLSLPCAEKAIHKNSSLNSTEVCIFDSSNAKPETPLMDTAILHASDW